MGKHQRVLRKQMIVYQGFNGLEIEVKDSEGITFVFRFFITAKNAVALGYGSRDTLDMAKANKFFESLRIHDPKPTRAR